MGLSLFLVIVTFTIYPLYKVAGFFFRGLMCNWNKSYEVLKIFDKITEWCGDNKKLVGYALLSILFLGTTYLQKLIRTPLYDLKSKGLIEVLSFSIAILGLYGIYIGFLQYLTDHNEGKLFLGKSKINYLINNSVWYQTTQTPLFFIILLIATAFPVLFRFPISPSKVEVFGITINLSYIELTYLWQTAIILLLIIYLFLLQMSLKVIKITLLMKAGTDSGLQNIMEREIQKKYNQIFWREYNAKQPNYDIFVRRLDWDFKKLKVHEFDCYVEIVFAWINEEFLFKQSRKFWKEKNLEQSHRYYIKHLSTKWGFLSSYVSEISYNTWQKLAFDDIQNVTWFEKQFQKRSMVPNSNIFHEKYTTEYLFDQLMKKSDLNLQDIINTAENSTKELLLSNTDANSNNHSKELETYKWDKIFREYHASKSEANLPNHKTEICTKYISESEQGLVGFDYYNSHLYSKACFDFLTDYYGRISEDIESNHCLKALIHSMNNEYLVSFSLYQWLYPSSSSWKLNFEFFNNILEDILSYYDENKFQYYYNTAKDIIKNTNISPRIEQTFLKLLWTTKDKPISSLNDWYNQFGIRHYCAPFLLLYIQRLFSTTKITRYNLRVNMTQYEDIANSICLDYFNLLEYYSELQKKEDLFETIKQLISVSDFDYKKLIRDMKLKGILHLEYVLKSSFSLQKRVPYQNIFFESIQVDFNDKTHYSLYGNDMVHFWALKMTEDCYSSLFKTQNLMEQLKYEMNNYLERNDLTILDYAEQIYQMLLNDDLIKISGIKKAKVVHKMQILLEQSTP